MILHALRIPEKTKTNSLGSDIRGAIDAAKHHPDKVGLARRWLANGWGLKAFDPIDLLIRFDPE